MFPYTQEQIDAAYKKNGFTPVRRSTFEYDEKYRIIGCCPLGSLVAAKYNIKTWRGAESHGDFTEALKLTKEQLIGFVDGYDGGSNDFDNEEYKEAFKFGKKVYRTIKKTMQKQLEKS